MVRRATESARSSAAPVARWIRRETAAGKAATAISTGRPRRSVSRMASPGLSRTSRARSERLGIGAVHPAALRPIIPSGRPIDAIQASMPFFICLGVRSALWVADGPAMAERDRCTCAVPVSPEHVGGRHHRPGASGDGAREDGVHVLHVEHERHRGAVQGLRGGGPHLRGLVAQHDDRVADPDLGVHQLPVGPGHARQLLRAERLHVEGDGVGRAADGERGGDRSVCIRNRLHLPPCGLPRRLPRRLLLRDLLLGHGVPPSPALRGPGRVP